MISKEEYIRKNIKANTLNKKILLKFKIYYFTEKSFLFYFNKFKFLLIVSVILFTFLFARKNLLNFTHLISCFLDSILIHSFLISLYSFIFLKESFESTKDFNRKLYAFASVYLDKKLLANKITEDEYNNFYNINYEDIILSYREDD